MNCIPNIQVTMVISTFHNVPRGERITPVALQTSSLIRKATILLAMSTPLREREMVDVAGSVHLFCLLLNIRPPVALSNKLAAIPLTPGLLPFEIYL